MTALVVYESMFGNTEKVARAIAAGLAESMAVVTTPVGGAPDVPTPTSTSSSPVAPRTPSR